MKRPGYFTALLFVLLPLASLQAQGNLPPVGDNWQARYTNGIAAVVNDQIITIDELRREMAPLVPQVQRDSMTRDELNQKLDALAFEILRNMIDRILIVQDFREKGYQIPKVFVENEYDDYINKQFNGDRAAFHRWLKDEGKTPRMFREGLQDKMIIDYMRSQMRRSQSAVSPAKIEQYYAEHRDLFYEKERVKLRQIMLAPYAKETPELLMQEARKIIRELEMGTGFEELARKYSQDDKARNGGDWGWIERTDLASQLADVAFSLPEGTYSEPIIKEGYLFILYVEDRHDEGVQPLAKVRDQIEEALSGELARSAQKIWLDRLRKDAFVKYYL